MGGGLPCWIRFGYVYPLYEVDVKTIGHLRFIYLY